MASTIKKNQIAQTIKNFNTVNLEQVYRENLGDGSLSEIKPYIESIVSNIEILNSIIDEIPDSVLTKFNNGITELSSKLSTIERYNDSTFIAQRQNSSSFFINNADKSQEWISDINTFKAVKEIKELDLANINDQLKKDIRAVKAEKGKIDKVKQALETRIGEFERRYSNTTTKHEIQHQSDHYEKEADKHKTRSQIWLFLIVIYVPILLVFIYNAIVFGNMMTIDFEADKVTEFNQNCDNCASTFLNYQFIRGFGMRILLFSILLYILSFIRKNYNAEKHNQILNEQRANSLNSSLMLLDKANTDQGKDEILRMACNAIFSQQNTGFIKKENDNNIKLLDSIKTTIST